MLAESQSMFDGANAMLIEGGGLFGALWQIIIRILVGFDGAAFQERDRLIQDTGIGEAGDVAAGGVRQPKVVVGNLGANAAVGRRMPPMLDIAFAELMSG